jgi:glycosyltransferase involved in cell wall biosynthesis
LSTNKHIALITTWFPPQQSVATNRMLAFAEFLSLNHEVDVFALLQEQKTIKWSDRVTVHYASNGVISERLKDKQSDGYLLHLFKVGTRKLLNVFVKNPLRKWQKSTLAQLNIIHESKPFDCIISSFSPEDAHLIAINFKKAYPHIPWIADMRDEMSMHPYIDSKTRSKLAAIEKEVNRYADALTSVSEPILSDFKSIMPQIKYFEEIRNGFNHNYQRDLSNTEKNSVFTIGYFGTFYGIRKPHILMQALKQLLVEVPEFDFEFEIVGAHQNFSIPSEISEKVKLRDPLTYLDAIQKMAKVDATIQIDPRSKRKGVYTGKLFDYISVQKPVLGFLDLDDVAAALIREFDCGYIAEFSDLEENKKIILEAFMDWKQNSIKFASDAQVQTLHRKKQVEKLNHLISKLTQ